MRFLIRLGPTASARENFLSSVRTLAKSLGLECRNPKWTSYGALEVDIFAPGRADFELFIATIKPLYRVEFQRDLNEAPPHRSEEELVSEARAFFNSERYWESHEVLEGIWRLKTGEEKRFLQGLILICAAFVHHQKGEELVALRVVRRALPQLEYKDKEYHGIDVQLLRRKSEEILRSLRLDEFTI